MATRLPPAWVVRPLLAGRDAICRLHDRIVPPQMVLLERNVGLIETKTIAVVAELGIADQLANGPADSSALAAACGADPDALERILRFLVARGVFRRGRDGRYANNRVSELLRADVPSSMRDWSRFFGSKWHVDAWNELEHSARTGGAAAEVAFGRSFWEQVTQVDPDAGSLFDGAMADMSSVQMDVIPRKYDFSGCRDMCDVGGGTGTLLSSILRANPAVRGTLFDLPSVVAKAAPVLERAGVADRVQVVTGDFFESVPDGRDRYLLQAILHDWDDDSCTRILTNIATAMAPDARVLVFEQVLPEHDGWHPAKATDLEMLVDTGAGRERTREDFVALFDRAGFDVARTRALPILTIFELTRRISTGHT